MRRRWGWLSAATLLLLLAITVLTSLLVRGAVRSQEDRLLKERANEVGLVLREAVDSLSSQIRTVGGVARATNSAPVAFKRSSEALVDGSDGRDTLTLLRRTAAGYRVELANGDAYAPGQTISGPLIATLDRAAAAGDVVPTQLMGTGADRTLGFAVGPPDAPAGTVIYLQVNLGTLKPPRAAKTSPFHEIRTALYATPTPAAAQALVASSTSELPMQGDVRVVTIEAGAARWALQVKAVHPLVGGTTANAGWLVLGAGIVLSALMALVVEIETRRRRSALALYRSEHEIAESLQRSLLPNLPELDDLDIAARYLPGAAGQQVGGDWYDVFEIDDDHIGLAVGDVLGHDIEAAALMSRVQTALRAHALVGESPKAVLTRLDQLVTTLETDRLVTVFYGVLGPPGANGARKLVFANAGHPPPLLHAAGGVVELDDANSILLGVSNEAGEPRSQHTVTVPPDSTLLLYTDGLIEVPGLSMTDLIGDLKLATSAAAADSTAEQLCDWLLETMRPAARRDDVAMLVVQLAAERVLPEPEPAMAGRRANT